MGTSFRNPRLIEANAMREDLNNGIDINIDTWPTELGADVVSTSHIGVPSKGSCGEI